MINRNGIPITLLILMVAYYDFLSASSFPGDILFITAATFEWVSDLMDGGGVLLEMLAKLELLLTKAALEWEGAMTRLVIH